MRAFHEPWLLAMDLTCDADAVGGAAWQRWLATLARPFALPEHELPAALRFGSALGWTKPASLSGDFRRQVADALVGAAAVAARQRLVEPCHWLLDRSAAYGHEPAAAQVRAQFDGLMTLESGRVAPGGSAPPNLAPTLDLLDDLRRYGVEEASLRMRLGKAIGVSPAEPAEPLTGWAEIQLNLVAAWAGLTRGLAGNYRKLVARSTLLEDSWVGWLVLGRTDPPVAEYRAYTAAEAAWRVAQPLAGHDRVAAAWWRAEAAGWGLVVAGAPTPGQIRECPPAILGPTPHLPLPAHGPQRPVPMMDETDHAMR